MMTTLNNRVSALFADPLQTVFSEIVPSAVEASLNDELAPLSIWEDGDAIYVEVDLPGVAVDDLSVDLEKGSLCVKGQRNSPDRRSQYDSRRFGAFERRIQLEDWVDPESVHADLADGVLKIRLAKKQVAKKQSIPIGSSSSNVQRLESESN